MFLYLLVRSYLLENEDNNILNKYKDFGRIK